MEKKTYHAAFDLTHGDRRFVEMEGTFDEVVTRMANYSAAKNILAGYGPCESKEALAEEIFCIENGC